jgi:hypothetical protein
VGGGGGGGGVRDVAEEVRHEEGEGIDRFLIRETASVVWGGSAKR